MIPILYEKNEKIFDTAGIGVLKDIVNLIITEERNGLFEMVFDYPSSSSFFNELQLGRIVVSDATNKLLNQRFVIIRIEKTSERLSRVYCEHISQYVTKNTVLNPDVNYSGSAQKVLETWKNNLLSDVKKDITVHSDITFEKKGNWSILKANNARKALGGVSGSIIDSFGGEYKFDNLFINLMNKRGQDNGAFISYGKNLTHLQQDEEIESTVTSIQPFVVVSEVVNEDYVEKVITLPEKVIHSEYVSNYEIPKIAVVEFASTEVKTVDELRKRAERYITENKIGIPKIKMKISFIDLASTIQYKDNARVEEINLCDLVTVDFVNLGIDNVKAKVVKTSYNPILERYTSIEIGTIGTRFHSTVIQKGNTIEDITEDIKTVRNEINKVRVNANGQTLIFYQVEEPVAKNINDRWYKDLGNNDTEIRIWTGAEWKLILSTKEVSIAKEKAEESILQITNAKEQAQQALEKANNSVDKDSLIEEINLQAKNNIFMNVVGSDKSVLNITKDGTYIEKGIIEEAHIKDGTITDAKIKDLSFDWARGKTLDAEEVNVVNLNGDSLVFDEIFTNKFNVSGIGAGIDLSSNQSITQTVSSQVIGKLSEPEIRAQFKGETGKDAAIYSETAPKDTTRLWIDSRNNTPKYFNRGAGDWTTLTEEVYAEIKDVQVNLETKITDLPGEIISTASKQFISTETGESILEKISSVDQTADSIIRKFDTYVTSNDEKVDNIDTTLNKFSTIISEGTNGINISKSNSDFNINIDNDSLDIRNGENVVAYASKDKFYGKTMEVLDEFIFDYVKFMKRDSGNISLIKINR